MPAAKTPIPKTKEEITYLTDPYAGEFQRLASEVKKISEQLRSVPQSETLKLTPVLYPDNKMRYVLSEAAKKINLQFKSPRYGDAGYDIEACLEERLVIPPGSSRLIDTGLSLEIPHGWVGIIKDRSSMATKNFIETAGGVIDASYRGEIKVLLRNMGLNAYAVNPRDRIAQLLIVPHLAVDVEQAKDLSVTNRGTDGFGSTGK